jgi:hypothetical protein
MVKKTKKIGRKAPLLPSQVEMIISHFGNPPTKDYIVKVETYTSLARLYCLDYRTFIKMVDKILWKIE